MCIAYLTSDRDSLSVIFSDPDTFTGATPFLFLAASLLVLVFGAGELSVDGLIGRWYRSSRKLPEHPVP
jgi:putative oxidoreductase